MSHTHFTHTRSSSHRRHLGFTLVEILVSTSILVLVIGMSLTFYTSTSKVIYTSDAKIQLNNESRHAADEFLINSRSAQMLVLYRAYGTSNITEENRRTTGQTGNFLVLVFSETLATGFVQTRLLGYYRRNINSIPNIYQFDFEVPEADQALTLEEIILKHRGSFQVTPFLEDIIPTDTNFFFYHLANNKSAQVNGIMTKGSGKYEQTKIINLTVTVRG